MKAGTTSAARNQVYLDTSAEKFLGATRVSCGWDGSSHGGQEVILGFATDLRTGLSVYLAPTAPDPFSIRSR